MMKRAFWLVYFFFVTLVEQHQVVVVSAQLKVGNITSFRLINAETKEDLGLPALSNNQVLWFNDPALPPEWTIYATTNDGPVGSVAFSLYSQNYDYTLKRTEGYAPWTVSSDNNPWSTWKPVPMGFHTLWATPYEFEDREGTKGKVLQMNFTVVESLPRSPASVPAPRPAPAPVPAPRPVPAPVHVPRPVPAPVPAPRPAPAPLPARVPAPAPRPAPAPVPVPAPVSTDVQPYMFSPAGTLNGELRKWHKITLGFVGPFASETDAHNPFTNYLFNVTYSHAVTGKTYVVPGYFAADGNAANSGASAGNVWLCHFAPDQDGQWNWSVQFYNATNIIHNGGPGLPTNDSPHGRTGSFIVLPTNKTGRDHRGKGRLNYVGKHHLQFTETGEYFLKAGVDSPENFLAYNDFDNTPDYKGLRKSWSPHVGDWKVFNPTWNGGEKGKGALGALNYLARKGLNVFSFLTFNNVGDDRNVFMYTNSTELLRIDVSKTAQWEVLLEHADGLGLYLHFKLSEREVDFQMDDGELGIQRKVYYREIIARFGHHLALNWNIGEENGNTDPQKQAFAAYFQSFDPYNHPLVIHSWPSAKNATHGPLVGYNTWEGASLQSGLPRIGFNETLEWVQRSADAGRKWVVCIDEVGPHNVGVLPDDNDPTHDNIRKDVLWGNIMAGGSGVEYYYGYDYEESDLTLQDFRTRSNMFDQSKYALDFFIDNSIPFWDMSNDNSRLSAFYPNRCLAQSNGGNVILVQLVNGGSETVDLSGDPGSMYSVQWFDPFLGGSLTSTGSLRVGNNRPLNPPYPSARGDWVVVLRRV